MSYCHTFMFICSTSLGFSIFPHKLPHRIVHAFSIRRVAVCEKKIAKIGLQVSTSVTPRLWCGRSVASEGNRRTEGYYSALAAATTQLVNAQYIRRSGSMYPSENWFHVNSCQNMGSSLPGWLLETWIEYAISVSVAIVRLVLRTRLLGFREWQGDDYLVVTAICFFTLDVTCFQVINRLGTNIGLTSETLSGMTALEISNLRTGSILNQVSWYTWSGHLWACKGCMLFLYNRLTMRLWQRKMVLVTSWLVAFTFIGGYLVNTFKCWPVGKNWQVVPPPGGCPAGAANLFFTGTTNFITDILILSIPLPMLQIVNLPLKKRLLVTAIFGSGLLIVIVSALRFIFSILAIYGTGPPDLGFRLGWTARENSTSLIIVNVPIIFSTIQRLQREQVSSAASRQESRAPRTSRVRSTFMTKSTIEMTATRITTGHMPEGDHNRPDSYIMIHENISMGDEEKSVASRSNV